MPDITEDTPTKNIVVQGIILQGAMPYEAGHTCTENEAHTLNQTLLENLRNNFAPRVKKAQEEAEKNGAEVDRAALQAAFDSYQNGYEFGVRTSTGALDPISAIAMDLATGKVKEALKAKGFKLKDVGAEKIRELAQSAIEANPAFKAKAEEIHKARLGAADELSVDVD